MGSYTHLYWICPFYRYDEKTCVHCEEGSRVKFKNLKTLRQYEKDYCASMDGYLRCSIAKTLERQYEEREEYEKERKEAIGKTGEDEEADRRCSASGKGEA